MEILYAFILMNAFVIPFRLAQEYWLTVEFDTVSNKEPINSRYSANLVPFYVYGQFVKYLEVR